MFANFSATPSVDVIVPRARRVLSEVRLCSLFVVNDLYIFDASPADVFRDRADACYGAIHCLHDLSAPDARDRCRLQPCAARFRRYRRFDLGIFLRTELAHRVPCRRVLLKSSRSSWVKKTALRGVVTKHIARKPLRTVRFQANERSPISTVFLCFLRDIEGFRSFFIAPEGARAAVQLLNRIAALFWLVLALKKSRLSARYMVGAGCPHRHSFMRKMLRDGVGAIRILKRRTDPRTAAPQNRHRIGAGCRRRDRANKFIYDLWGDTVNTASRMESLQAVEKSTLRPPRRRHSGTRRAEFVDRGEIEIKGIMCDAHLPRAGVKCGLSVVLLSLFFAGACQSWGKILGSRRLRSQCLYTEAIQAERAEQFMYHLRAQRDKGATGLVTRDITTISGLTTSDLKWSGGVLNSNGKIYTIPRQSDAVAVIDPDNDTITRRRSRG